MRSTTFELFRVSLIPREQPDMLKIFGSSRYDDIERIFAQRWEFSHYGKPFHYVPARFRHSSRYLLGRFGRAVTSIENAPPDGYLEEEERKGWQASAIVVDPRDRGPGGQKLAFQANPKVGKSLSILKSFFSFLNENRESEYVFKCEPIFDARSFWKFAEENKDQITSITFTFVVPNGIWIVGTSIREDLKAVDTEIGGEEVTSSIKTSTSIKTESKQIKDAIDYVETGSGTVRARARARTGAKFDSRNKRKRVEIEFDEGEKGSTLERVSRQADAILNEEKSRGNHESAD